MEPTPFTFTSAELERLARYKLAVEAGYYTDACEDVHDTPNLLAEPEPQPEPEPAPAEAVLSAPDVRRLAAFRRAVALGIYSEQL